MNKRSFTYAELLTSMAILVAFSAAILVTVISLRTKARDTKRTTDLAILSQALESYYYDYHKYPIWTSDCIENTGASGNPFIPGHSSGFNDKYLSPIPKDPLYERGGYCYYYKTNLAGSNYHLLSRLEKDTKGATDGGRWSDFYEAFATAGQPLIDVGVSSVDVKNTMNWPLVSASWIVESKTGDNGFDAGNYDLDQTGNTAFNTAGGYNPASGAVELAQEEYYTDAELPQTGLVGYWRMNEVADGTCTGSKDVCDLSGSGNHGTRGTTANTPDISDPTRKSGIDCKFGNCLSFDGSNDYVNKPNPTGLPTGSTSSTIGAWVYLENYGSPGYSPIITWGTSGTNQVRMFNAGWPAYGNKVAFHLYSNDITFDYVINLNQWYHLVVVFNNVNAVLYVNGVQVSSKTLTGANTGATYLEIGKFSGGGVYFNGTIDEVAIWNRSLSASEIADLYRKRVGYYQSKVYNAEATAKWKTLSWLDNYYWQNYTIDMTAATDASLRNGLKGYWRMNEATSGPANGLTIIDQTGVNNGVANYGANAAGMTWTTGKFPGTTSGALSFDGSDDYINLGNPTDLQFNETSYFTVSAWVNVSNWAAQYAGRVGIVISRLIDASPNFNWEIFVLNSSGVYNFQVYIDKYGTGGPVLTSTTQVQLNNWYHIVWVYNNTNTQLYINEIREDNKTRTFSGSAVPNTNVLIGRRSSTWSQSLNGLIDEVAIWSRALTESEIQELYRRGTTRLKLQARSCSDSTCSTDPSWSEYTTNTSNDLSTLSPTSTSQFIQFKALFEADNSLSTPTFHISNATPYLKQVQVGFEK